MTAAICRKYNWKVGMCLMGDEGNGPDVIRITAIGEARILARLIWSKGRFVGEMAECTWTLELREWKHVVFNDILGKWLPT